MTRIHGVQGKGFRPRWFPIELVYGWIKLPAGNASGGMFGIGLKVQAPAGLTGCSALRLDQFYAKIFRVMAAAANKMRLVHFVAGVAPS